MLVADNMSHMKVYETVVDWEYEQKCTTSYEEECHGYGYHQECEKVICFAISHALVADKPVFLCPPGAQGALQAGSKEG